MVQLQWWRPTRGECDPTRKASRDCPWHFNGGALRRANVTNLHYPHLPGWYRFNGGARAGECDMLRLRPANWLMNFNGGTVRRANVTLYQSEALATCCPSMVAPA